MKPLSISPLTFPPSLCLIHTQPKPSPRTTPPALSPPLSTHPRTMHCIQLQVCNIIIVRTSILSTLSIRFLSLGCINFGINTIKKNGLWTCKIVLMVLADHADDDDCRWYGVACVVNPSWTPSIPYCRTFWGTNALVSRIVLLVQPIPSLNRLPSNQRLILVLTLHTYSPSAS